MVKLLQYFQKMLTEQKLGRLGVTENIRLLFVNHKAKALAMDSYNIYFLICVQMFSKLGNVNIHTAGIKVTVISPNNI